MMGLVWYIINMKLALAQHLTIHATPSLDLLIANWLSRSFKGLPSSNTQLSGGFSNSNGDANGVKFISLAAPLQNDVRCLSTASREMRQDSSKSMGK